MTRGRPPEIDRPVALNLRLPESERGRLDLILHSDVEGRVPKGAYAEFFKERLREFFTFKTLDLAPFGFEPGFYVKGPADMIDALERRLKQ